MRANRRTDTKPEMALRRALHRQGYRYRKDYRLDLAEGKRVRPDIAFTARRVAVFVDGCFWHACPEHGTKPAAQYLVLGAQAAPQRRARPGRGRGAGGGGLGGGPGLGARVAGRGGDRGRPRRARPAPARLALRPSRVTAGQLALGRDRRIGRLTAAIGRSWRHHWHTRILALGLMRVYSRSPLAGPARPAPAPVRGFAVTPALREWYSSGDEEELEYVAMTQAARASLRLLHADPGAPARRVVLAAEVPSRAGGRQGRVRRARTGRDQAAGPAGRRGLRPHRRSAWPRPTSTRRSPRWPPPTSGDEDARFTVDSAEGHELLWYATQELRHVTG